MNILIPGALLTIVGLWSLNSVRRVDFIFILAIIGGIYLHVGQDNIGNDYKIYLDFFQGNVPVNNSDPLFLLFSQVVSKLDPSGFLGLLVFSIVIVGGYGIFIYRWIPHDKLFGLALFFLLPIFYVNSLNLMRAHFAIAIILSILSMKKPRALLFSIGGITALGFHNIAIMTLVPYFNSKMPLWSLRYFIFGFMLLAFPIFTSFESEIAKGLGYGYFLSHSSDNNQAFLIVFAFLCLMLAVLYDLNNLYMKDAVFWGNIITFYFLCLYFVSDLANFWLRFCQATFPFFIIAFANFLDAFRPKLFVRWVKIFISICLMINLVSA